MDHARFDDDLPPPQADHPDYPQWLCRAVGARLKRRRASLRKMAMGLAHENKGTLSDQAILNNEARGNGVLLVNPKHRSMRRQSLKL